MVGGREGGSEGGRETHLPMLMTRAGSSGVAAASRRGKAKRVRLKRDVRFRAMTLSKACEERKIRMN